MTTVDFILLTLNFITSGYVRNRCLYWKQKALPILINGLRRLEYRGYDSAGVAILNNGGFLSAKAVGKIDKLVKKINGQDLAGTFGIAHTRWATHGGVTESNAHPHLDCTGKISLAHNGIIENYRELKRRIRHWSYL